MMESERLFRAMVEQDASDLFLKVGHRPFLRIHGRLLPVGEERLTREQITAVVSTLLAPQQRQRLHAERELTVAFERDGVGRFRANVLWQRGTMALVIRRVQRLIPTLSELGLPGEVLTRLLTESHGLVLVTGPTGAGKSTTAASMLDHVNHTAAKHLVTLEDPIEFHFTEELAIINQREIGADTLSFGEGLRNVLRQSPDLLFVSDIRDAQTMESCLVAAESGQLVLSCIHTTNAVTTVERLVALAPLHQHQIIRLRLSLILRGIISLRLLPRLDGAGRVPACEVLVATPTVRELIREGRTERLPAVIHNGAMYGMQTLTQALYHRYRQGEVDLAEALRSADSPEELQLAVREVHSTGDVPSSES